MLLRLIVIVCAVVSSDVEGRRSRGRERTMMESGSIATDDGDSETARSLRFEETKARIATEDPSDPTKQSKECNACVEVATAWREKFACGTNVALDIEWTPEAVIEPAWCPWVMDCRFFASDDEGGPDLEEICEMLKEQIIVKYDDIYNALRESKTETEKETIDHPRIEIFANNPQTWVMNMLEKTNVGAFPPCSIPQDGQDAACRMVLLSDVCRDNPSCAEANELCSDECRIAFWLITHWFPFFPQNSDKKRRYCKGKKTRDGLWAPLETEAQATYTNLPSIEECIDLWDVFRLSSKARYLTQYTDRLGEYDWDPYTVCKCLQICAYSETEAFDLISACAFETNVVRTASLFPELTLPNKANQNLAPFPYTAVEWGKVANAR